MVSQSNRASLRGCRRPSGALPQQNKDRAAVFLALRPARRSLLRVLRLGAAAASLRHRPAKAGSSFAASARTRLLWHAARDAQAREDAVTLRLLERSSTLAEADRQLLRAARAEADSSLEGLFLAMRDDAGLPADQGLRARLRLVEATLAARRSLRRRMDRLATHPAALPLTPGEWHQGRRNHDAALQAIGVLLLGGGAAPAQPSVATPPRRSTAGDRLPPLFGAPASTTIEAEDAAPLWLGGLAASMFGGVGWLLWRRRSVPARRGADRAEVALFARLLLPGAAPQPAAVINMSRGGSALRWAAGTMRAGQALAVDVDGLGRIEAQVVEHEDAVLRLRFLALSPRQEDALARLTARGSGR